MHTAATSTRISNYLGASFPDNARLCARVAVAMCFVITLVTCTGVVASRNVLAYLFTADTEVGRSDGLLLVLKCNMCSMTGVCMTGVCMTVFHASRVTRLCATLLRCCPS